MRALVGFNGKAVPALWKGSVRGAGSLAGWDVLGSRQAGAPRTAGARRTRSGVTARPGSRQALDGAGGFWHLQSGAQRAPGSAVETAELDFPHSPLKISAAFPTHLGVFWASIKMHSLFYHENAQKGHGKKN